MNSNTEREIVIYKEHQQSFRSLNQQMWQIPVIAMTLTGGLWFAVNSLESDSIQRAALLFLASAGNFGLAIVLWRVRSLMQRLLTKMQKFEGELSIEETGTSWWDKPGMVRKVFTILLLFSGGISLLLAAKPLLQVLLRVICS